MKHEQNENNIAFCLHKIIENNIVFCLYIKTIYNINYITYNINSI